MLWNFYCHMTHLKKVQNKIRSHATLPLLVSKMAANLLDLWKTGSKRKPDTSKEEHLNNEKVTKYESWIRKFQPTWKKEFPWVKFDEEKKEMLCIACRKCPTVANKESRLYVGINGSSTTGFCRNSLASHERSHSHYFCFQRAKSKEKPGTAAANKP